MFFKKIYSELLSKFGATYRFKMESLIWYSSVI